jgi:putative DNA primase/helicase
VTHHNPEHAQIDKQILGSMAAIDAGAEQKPERLPDATDGWQPRDEDAPPPKRQAANGDVSELEVSSAARREANVHELAREITAKDHFAKDAGGRLYVFHDGVYGPTGESFVKARVKELYGAWGLAKKWSTHRAKEVAEYISVDCPELWANPPADTLNVANGLLDVLTRRLRPHSPDFLSGVQLPVTFDPSATCPALDEFTAQVFPADSEAIAWEILAWIMTPENRIQKAILLLGDGSNGKSTFLRVCVAFLGKRNTGALSLHKLEKDKFAAARLIGKLANVCPDLPTGHLETTSMFKALTGGDVVSAEFKFRDSFEYVPFAKLLFSANHPPRSDDASHGFFRRWQVVPFTRFFEEGASGAVNREELDASLADPSELSGALNKALLALEQIRKHGFTQSDSMRQALDEFRTATDPLIVWLDQNTVQLPNAIVPKQGLIAAFNKHCTDAGRPTVTATAFGLALKRARKGIEEAQRTWRGREKTWVYVKIGMRLGEGQREDSDD